MARNTTTISVTKETHKQLAIEKVKKEYGSFNEMFQEEILEGDSNE